MGWLEYNDIQALVFSGYRKMEYADYHLLRIGNCNSAKQWITTLLTEGKITHGEERPEECCQNIAFTVDGLSKLGLSKEDIESFEPAFVDRMSANNKAEMLGDKGNSHPEMWTWGFGDNLIDVVLMIFAKDQSTHTKLSTSETKLYKKHDLCAVKVLHADPIPSDGLQTEHFGFADGISQPSVDGFPSQRKKNRNLTVIPTVAAGEFVLGYPNEYGHYTKIPKLTKDRADQLSPLGKNGTYLVFRQLAQDVRGFWKFAEQKSTENYSPEYIAAKLVGRWPSGCIVRDCEISDPKTQPTNSFDFSDTDIHGYGCPLGSHIRRTNPRGVGLGESAKSSMKMANRHRLIRRGRRYGSPLQSGDKKDTTERGLLFLSINANIERQFEFIQHSWVNNRKFSGHYDESDPLIGSEPNLMTIPQRPVRLRLAGVKSFVSTRGGAYFFLPGIAALRRLASHDYRSPNENVELRPNSDSIPCPALLSLYNNGLLEPKNDGTVSRHHLSCVLERLGISRTVGKILTRGAAKTTSTPDMFNLFKLRDSILDHSGSTGIRDPKVNENKFSEVMQFSENGRMYPKHFAQVAKHCRNVDSGLFGTFVQTVEFAAVLALFGRVDNVGDKFLSNDDMHALWLRGEYPMSWVPHRKNSLGALPIILLTLKIFIWRVKLSLGHAKNSTA